MEILPAIDIRGGRCVRLLRGDFSAETVYGDPVEVAHFYARAGVRWVHVVDLEAARSGEPHNLSAVAAVAAVAGLRVQAGGGVRSTAAAERLIGCGVERVVLGTLAAEDPQEAERMAAAFPERIVVGLDHRSLAGERGLERRLAVHGWESVAAPTLAEMLERLAGVPLAALVVTDVGKDGTLEGPDVEGLASVMAATAHPVIASGGVASADDVRTLSELRHGGRRLAGAIVGKAILSGGLGLEEAMAACNRSG